jgi:hypothetical protein
VGGYHGIPAGTPDFGAKVLPIQTPLLYLGSLSTILRNQAFYRRKSRAFAGVDGRIDRQEEQDLRIYGLRQDERSL